MPSNDTTVKFRADISQLKAQMQQAERQIKLVNSEFKAATAGMDDWSKSADGLTAKTKQLTSVLDAQKSKLDLLEKEYEATTKAYGENSAAADKVLIKINNQKAAIAKTESELNNYEKELEDCVNGEGKFADSLEDSTKAADEASDGFTIMKGALADLVADGIRMAVDALKDLAKETYTVGANFEAAMSQVEAVSGATGSEIDALTEKAEEMGAKTKFSATESAEAFNYMAMAGWKTEDMLDGIEGIMNLAAASGSDLATTSDIVTDALTAMGYEAKDAGRLADVMAAASSNANTNVEMMGSTFQYAAPIVGALGYSMEDTAVAIGLMANAGIKGDKAGTALRSTLTRLSAPPKACAEAMEELGLSMTDSEGNMKDLSTVMSDLRNAFSGLSETQQTQYAKAIAGTTAMSGLLAIVNASTDDFNKLTEAVNYSAGAAEGMADTMNDNVNGQLTLLKSKIEGIMIKLFTRASESMTKGIHKVGDALDDVDWEKVGDSVGSFASKAVNFFAYLIKNGATVTSILKTIAATVATIFVVDKVGKFIGQINKLITTYGTFEAILTKVKGTQLALNAAQLASPVGVVVAGLTAMIATYAYARIESKKYAEEVYGLSDAEEKLNDSINESYESQKQLNESRDEAIESVTGEYNYIDKLKDEYNGLIDANGDVKDGYEDRASFILNELAEALGVEVSQIKEEIDANGKLGASIDELIQKKQAEATLSAYDESYRQAKSNEAQAIEDAVAAQNNYTDSLNDYINVEKQYQAAKEEYQGAVSAGATDTLYYEMQLASLGDQLTEAKNRLDENKTALENANQAYIDGQTTIQNYEGLSAAIISGDVSKINSEMDKLTSGFRDAKSSTQTELEEQLKNYKKTYEDMKQAVANGSKIVTQEMVDGAKESVDKAQDELNKLTGKAGVIGEEVGTSYADGIEDAQSTVKGAAGTLANTVIENTKTEKTISSGKETGESYAKGIIQTKKSAKDAGLKLATEAKKGAETRDTNTDPVASGEYFGQGFLEGLGLWIAKAYSKGYELAESAHKGVKDADGEGSPAKELIKSGNWFAQGFELGITRRIKKVAKAATQMTTSALDAVKKAQKEGSPSKLTYQSGVYFTQGFINGIVSLEGQLVRTASSMVSSAVSALLNVNNFDYDTAATNASSLFSSAIQSQIDYMKGWLTYQNQQMLADFDATITDLQNGGSNLVAQLQNESAVAVAQIQAQSAQAVANMERERDTAINNATDQSLARQAELQKEIDKIEAIAEKDRTKKQKQRLKELKAALEEEKNALASTTEALKNQYQNQIDSITTQFNNQIDATKAYYENLISIQQNNTAALVAEQQEMKEAYQQAASSMMSEFNEAMNDYATQAQNLIDSTMNSITDEYNAQYNALINKQNTLISKLKAAGDLFNISGANVITVNDITTQTEYIRRYTSKLKEIKQKVSSDLFDQIASYDMEEGEAFIDQLLSLSEAELQAYSDAFDEKMSLSEQLSQEIYQSDFDQVASDYSNAIQQAFADMPAQLQALGEQVMAGFLEGLTTNTSYMSDSIKTFVNAMIDTFKNDLGIHSPSKVAMELGEYTGLGFVEGLKSVLKTVQSTASQIADTVSESLDFSEPISAAKSATSYGTVASVGAYGTSTTATTQVINFNQTNNSPKALDRLTVYRQTNNLLFSAKVRLADV